MSSDGMIQATPIVANAAVAGQANGTWYCGFSLKETAAAVAHVRIREGGATGKILDTIPFAASEGVADYYGDAPIYCNGPIYVELVAGTLPEGTIRWR